MLFVFIMTKKILFYLSFISIISLFPFISSAQVKKGEILEFTDVYDSAYGIHAYDALCIVMGGDSTRNDGKGYAAQGWMEDDYPDGKVLHKGYYIDGQLKAYKNYFPNAQLEREFKMTDLNKSNLIVYYEDGKLRSNVISSGSNVLKEEDYFPGGQLEYIEEYDKKGEYYLQRKFYSANGKPTSLLEITDQKRKIYSSKEFYDNGNVKEEGQMIFNSGLGDYQKDGKWKFYDENGKLKEEKTFTKGEEGGE